MKSTFKTLPGSKINLEVTLDAKEFLTYWEHTYENARGKVELKGFRKGTAPKELADAAIDKEKVFHESAERAVRKSLEEVTQEHNWIIIDQPKVEIVDASKTKGTGLKYKAELTIFPEVKLGNYKRLAKKVFEEKKEVTVDDQEVEKSLNWVRESRATEVRVDREVKTGDMVEVDIDATMDKKPLPDATLKKDKFLVGKSNFMPGFDEKLIGHKEKDEFDFTLTAPKDYWKAELQNKEISFKVTIHGVFERNLSELNDEFAKSLGPDFKTVEDVKKNIREGLIAEKQSKETQRIQLKILREIAKESTMDIPEIMIEKMIDQMAANVKAMLQGMDKKEEELRNELRDRAKENVENQLVLQAIARKEKIVPTPEEIEADLKNRNLYSTQSQGADSESNRSIDQQKHYEYSYSVIQTQKVFSFLEKQE